MAIVVTNVGQNSNTAGPTCAVTVPGGGIPAGSLIIALATERDVTDAQAWAIIDTAVNTYTSPSGGLQFSFSGNHGWTTAWYVQNSLALSAGDTISYTKSVSGDQTALSVIYATGIATSGALDAAVTSTASGNSTTPSTTSGAPVTAGELFIGSVGSLNAGGVFTQAGGWTTIAEAASATVRINGGYQIVASGAQTYNPTFGGVDRWGEIIIGFKATGGAAGTPQFMPFFFP